MRQRLLIIVSRLLQGGIDTILIEYLKRFDRERFSISLAVGICMEEREVYIDDVPADVPVHYLVKRHTLVKYRKLKTVHRLSFPEKAVDEIVLSPLRRIIQQRNLNKLIAQHDIVIDFDSTFYSFLRNCPIPKIAFFHFSFRQYHNGNPRKLERLGRKLEVYDRVITICEEMRAEGAEMYPHLKDKFVTIYNAFDFDRIRQQAEEEEVDEKLTGIPYILAVQRLEETQKDLTTLIKAYKLLVDKYGLEEHLYVIGEGRSKKELEDLCQSLGLKDRVLFLGRKSNPYCWMKHSRLFVLSSKFEGFGIVLIEAMSLGIPSVSTSCPTGPSEILDYGKAGGLVKVGDVDGMAEEIYRMLSDTEYRLQIEEHMRLQIRKFDIHTTIREIEDQTHSVTGD